MYLLSVSEVWIDDMRVTGTPSCLISSCGIMWYDMIWHDIINHDMVWYAMI